MGLKGYVARMQSEKAREAAEEGIVGFCRKQQWGSAAELALAFVEKESTVAAAEAMRAVISAHAEADGRFLRDFFRCVAKGGACKLTPADTSSDGMAKLHSAYARYLMNEKQYAEAQAHFLLGLDPAGMKLLVDTWSPTGQPEEQPLFVVRPFLLYLAHQHPQQAHRYLKLSTETPLTPFCNYLIIALQRSAKALFQYLTRSYDALLSRDPKLTKLLQQIEAVYLNSDTVKFPTDFAAAVEELESKPQAASTSLTKHADLD
eukprot:gene8377-12916_t